MYKKAEAMVEEAWAAKTKAEKDKMYKEAKAAAQAMVKTAKKKQEAARKKGCVTRIGTRQWVVVVHLNTGCPEQLHLCVLPNSAGNFGAIALSTLQRANSETKHYWNLAGAYYYEDVIEGKVNLLRSFTPRGKTRALKAGSQSGTVVYFFAETNRVSDGDVENAVKALNLAHFNVLQAFLNKISDATIASKGIVTVQASTTSAPTSAPTATSPGSTPRPAPWSTSTRSTRPTSPRRTPGRRLRRRSTRHRWARR